MPLILFGTIVAGMGSILLAVLIGHQTSALTLGMTTLEYDVMGLPPYQTRSLSNMARFFGIYDKGWKTWWRIFSPIPYSLP